MSSYQTKKFLYSKENNTENGKPIEWEKLSNKTVIYIIYKES